MLFNVHNEFGKTQSCDTASLFYSGTGTGCMRTGTHIYESVWMTPQCTSIQCFTFLEVKPDNNNEKNSGAASRAVRISTYSITDLWVRVCVCLCQCFVWICVFVWNIYSDMCCNRYSIYFTLLLFHCKYNYTLRFVCARVACARSPDRSRKPITPLNCDTLMVDWQYLSLI